MKKIFFISILLIIVHTGSVNAQTSGVPDTLAYLQTVVANKAQYIGHPFSSLLSNLQIQIKFFSPIASIPYFKNKETSTSFAFYFPLSHDEIYLTYPSLEIYWQPHLNASQSSILYTQYNGGGWNSTVYNFYSNAIISDIKVLN